MERYLFVEQQYIDNWHLFVYSLSIANIYGKIMYVYITVCNSKKI